MLLVLFAYLSLTHFALAQRCVNEQGAPVDWFVAYKFPRHSAVNASETSWVDQGLGYAYVDDRTVETKGWALSKLSVGELFELKLVNNNNT